MVALAGLAPGRWAAAQVAARFDSLGTLRADGSGPVIPYGVSADGNTIVGQANSATGLSAFRWTRLRGLEPIGQFPNPGGFQSSVARAVSADGSVIVGASVMPNSLNEDGSPFRWTAQTGLVFLGSLGGTDGGVARGVSLDGNTIAGYGSNPDFAIEAFRWTPGGGLQRLGDLPGASMIDSIATGLSGDGLRIIGTASQGRGFLWMPGTGMTDPGVGFGLFAISTDGNYIVGARNGRAMRKPVEGPPESLPHIALGSSPDTDQAWAVNADGSVITGLMNLNQGVDQFGRAFVWDTVHQTRLVRDVLANFGVDVSGWDLNNATAVSGDGSVIAGYGFAPSGEQLGWVVTLSDGSLGACCAPGGGCASVIRTACDGAWFRGAACSPTPCAAVAASTGPCCAGGACTVTTRAGCAGGDWSVGGACEPNPCQPPEETGSCCLTFNMSCTVTTQSACFADWTAGQVCDPNPCMGLTGSCCTGSACTIVALGACPDRDGFTLFGVCAPNPCCRADFNHSGTVSVQDIFDFLAAYFTNAPTADINGSGAVSVQDIFDYLALYFAGC